jgi:exodeoxyribonuclease V gamma subunit
MQDGIIVYRASRLEALLPPLLSLMDAAPPAQVLAPQDVIAAHPGIRQWLTRALARARGAGGIAANVDILLPSAWLDGLALLVLGEAAVALRPYRREALRWRIHELLPGITDPQVAAYLRGVDAPRRRFQLADRIAGIYTRYLVYRPDWLQHWLAGHDTVPEPSFLAPLWRELRRGIGLAHRGERLSRLMLQLDNIPKGTLPEQPLHVFGISHLAPTEFATLCAVARQRPVVLYVPDPCREYWAGLRPERDYLRELAAAPAFSETSEREFLELGHPLLASWGRLGQHFVLGLASAENVAVDIRHGEDEGAVPPADAPRLLRLQESIRQLDPALLATAQPQVEQLRDRSLRIHTCHTRLRELEVLRDVLLREREERPDLKPSDIVVMAPDIQAYVPLLPAVFGQPGQLQGLLPYHLADVPLLHGHPLLLAFAGLLDLPQTRLSAAQVLDLLATPAIAAALGLDAGGLGLLENWILRSRVAWALDADFRARREVPPISEHTFAWGMDRLLAGYVLGGGAGGEMPSLHLPDDTVLVPVEGVQGVQAEVLGALDRLLHVLAQLCRDADRPRTLSAWARRWEVLLDSLFRVDFNDAAGSDALNLLRRLLRGLAADAADAQLDPEVEFIVVREVLRERLLALSERQRFLMGGMTVCGMVPQRAIPFRVVAVLGLNDGEFPRPGSDAGLDLMARHRRLGDRDVRSDDRYLLLETVMAAREVLHLSYVGEGVRDARPRNPATPLAELMNLLDAAAGLRSDEAGERAWLVRHPLQPFDARYFDATDVRLYSYRADLIGLLRGGGVAATAFNPATDPAPVENTSRISLASALLYFRKPAEQVLTQRLGLRLDALEPDRLADSEPLDPLFERLDRVAPRLFHDCMDAGRAQLGEQPPDWLRHGGLWPVGRAGRRAWREQRAEVDGLLTAAGTEALFQSGAPRRAPQAVDLDIGGLRVQGELVRIYHNGGGDWVFDLFTREESRLDFGVRIGLFLEWALLQLQHWDAPRPVQVLLLCGGGARPWQDALNAWSAAAWAAHAGGDAALRASLRADLQQRIAGLLALYVQAQDQPPWYFPRTSWVAATAPHDDAAILASWLGNDHQTGERDYVPGYARLLAAGTEFAPGSAPLLQLKAVADYLYQLINVDKGAAAHG